MKYSVVPEQIDFAIYFEIFIFDECLWKVNKHKVEQSLWYASLQYNINVSSSKFSIDKPLFVITIFNFTVITLNLKGEHFM